MMVYLEDALWDVLTVTTPDTGAKLTSLVKGFVLLLHTIIAQERHMLYQLRDILGLTFHP